MAITNTVSLSLMYFSILLISWKVNGRKKPLLEQLKCEDVLCHDGMYILGMQGATPSVQLRQLLQWCCRTAQVNESSRRGKELWDAAQSTTALQGFTPCSCAAVAAATQERDAEHGAAARLMEISLSAALLVQSPTLSQNCSLSSAPIICWMQSWRAMQEQKLCSMTLQKVVPGGKGLSSHYPHKTNNPCCCWTALCSNSGSSALKINLSCYKYEKYSKSDVEEELKIYKWAPQGSKNLVHYGRELKYKWKHVPWIQMSSSYNSDLSKKLGWGGWGLFKKHPSWYCII